MTRQIIKIIIFMPFFLGIFIFSCDKYNVVEPRFFSPDDLVDIPWYDSTYSSVHLTLDIPENARTNQYIINSSGEFISQAVYRIINADLTSTFIWPLIDLQEELVEEQIYGLIVVTSILDHNNNVAEEYMEQVWFDLDFIEKSNFGIEFQGQYQEVYTLKDFIYYNNCCYILCHHYQGDSYNNGVLVVDCSDKSNPIYSQFISINGTVELIKYSESNNLLGVLTNSLLILYEPSGLGTLDSVSQLSQDIEDFYFYNDKIYTIDDATGYSLKAYDLLSPTNPVLLDSAFIETSGSKNIRIYDDIAYISQFEFLITYDLSEQSNFQLVSSYSLPLGIADFHIYDNYIYIRGHWEQIHLYEISNPGHIEYRKKNLLFRR